MKPMMLAKGLQLGYSIQYACGENVLGYWWYFSRFVSTMMSDICTVETVLV